MIRRIIAISNTAAITAALATALLGPVPAWAEPSIDDILSSVVRVRAEIPESARTAHGLGRKREGSGVIIDGNGLILTVGYIILESDRIRIDERGGRTLPAAFVGYDAESGFGLLRALKPLKGKAIQLAKSARIEPRHPILIVTHELEQGVKSAFVVSRRTFAGYWEYLLEGAIFTAPPIENYAGAALVNSDLQLVGIGSLFVRNAAGGEVILPGNMFIPIEKLYPVLADLIALGRPAGPAKPWLGVYVSETYGRVVVTRTAEGSPARTEGLGEGDLILKVAGKDVLDTADFYRKLWRLGNAGVKVRLSVLQGSEINRISLKSSDRYLHYRNPRMR